MNINKLKGIVIHCPTEEKANMLMKFFDKQGWTWTNGEKYSDSTNQWNKYRENTCYNPYSRVFKNLDYYNYRDFKIIPVDSFFKFELKYLL